MIHSRGEALRGPIDQGSVAPQRPGMNYLKQALAEIEAKLGICSPCIMSSIFLTLVFWALLIFFGPTIKNWYVLALVWFFACSFSILLLSHLVRFLYLNLRKSGNASRGSDGRKAREE